jgi:cytidylate kinase
MAIITISRGKFSGGTSLAECVAKKLGYRYMTRIDLIKAASQYGASEETLSDAIAEAPHFWERLSSERARHMVCLRSALINEVKENNIVYHGLAGHFLLMGIPGILKVRAVANIESRIKTAMERRALTREDATEIIKTRDDKRAKWVKFLYHMERMDPFLYDFILNLDQLSLSEACYIVCQTAGLGRFQATLEWKKVMDDLALSSHVRALIVVQKTISDREIEVEADAGVVTICGTVESLVDADRATVIAREVRGVKEVKSKLQVRMPGVTTRSIDEE